ncbi:MAG: tRNA pseudouridine(55) synthase TruB, partial [Pirellulales bacterium]
QMFGLLNLDKPRGLTSREVVNRVQRLVRPAKVGHTGTLDPLASGVLVVCVGPATRLVEYVQRMRKKYRATFLLGRTSATEDIEGEVTVLDDAPQPTRAEVERAAAALVGEIEQRPPVFSALKVRGRRACDLARRGHDLALAPRPIMVYRIDIERFDYPELVLDIECGGGTYVRSLGRDLAESLGSGAVMSELVRTAVGGFSQQEARPIDQLSVATLSAWLLPPVEALGSMPRMVLVDSILERVGRGQEIQIDLANERRVAAMDASGHLRAIVERKDDGAWWPVVNFPAGAS